MILLTKNILKNKSEILGKNNFKNSIFSHHKKSKAKLKNSLIKMDLNKKKFQLIIYPKYVMSVELIY